MFFPLFCVTAKVEILNKNFGVAPEPKQRYFKPSAVRQLCENFFDCLYEISIAPDNQEGWETISAADFKSYTGRFIAPSSVRMQQVRDNKSIQNNSFDSILERQILDPPMLRPCDVRFKLLKDSGITLSISQLELSRSLNDLEAQGAFFDFARQVYSKITQDKEIYSAVQTYQTPSLFDELE